MDENDNNVSKVLGIQHLDFKTNEGDLIKGDKLYIAYREDGIVGMKAEGIFLKDGFDLPLNLSPGDSIDILYNRKGKPIKITLAGSHQSAVKASTPTVSPAPAKVPVPPPKSTK